MLYHLKKFHHKEEDKNKSEAKWIDRTEAQDNHAKEVQNNNVAPEELFNTVCRTTKQSRGSIIEYGEYVYFIIKYFCSRRR